MRIDRTHCTSKTGRFRGRGTETQNFTFVICTLYWQPRIHVRRLARTTDWTGAKSQCAVTGPDTGLLSHFALATIFQFPSSGPFGCESFVSAHLSHTTQIRPFASNASNILRPLLTCGHHLNRFDQLRCLFQFQPALPDLILVTVLSQRVHLQAVVLELILDLKSAL
jgi:hypothetical protein